jgi:hypothetical protein
MVESAVKDGPTIIASESSNDSSTLVVGWRRSKVISVHEPDVHSNDTISFVLSSRSIGESLLTGSFMLGRELACEREILVNV